MIDLVLEKLLPRKIAPPAPKLTLTQTLTLTRRQFSSGAIVSLPPPTNPSLDQNSNLGGNFPRGAIVRIPIDLHRHLIVSLPYNQETTSFN